MPVTLPISGAKVGDVGAIGNPELINQRQGVFPAGINSTLAFGVQGAVYDPSSRPEVHLILAEARTSSMHFDFGEGARFIYQHTYSTHDVWGIPATSNAAKDIRPSGFVSSAVAYVTTTYLERYEKWVLDLNEPVSNSFNFYWDNPQLIYAHGQQNQRGWGNFISEQPLPIWGDGFLSYSGRAPRVSQAKVIHATKYIEFNLDLVDVGITGTNFPFGSPFITRPLGLLSQLFGTTLVGNAAQDIRPAGWSSSYVQPPVTSPLFGGGDKNFYFDQGRLSLNAANIGFYFAGGKQIDAGGWLSEEFGTSIVYLHLQPVVPLGIPTSNTFGDAFLDHFALKIRPTGLNESAFGTPKLPGVLKSHSWDSSIVQNFTKVDNWFKYLNVYPFTGQPPTPPSPKVYNLLQFVRPTGKAHSNAFGTSALTNLHRFINTTGWQDPDWYGVPWISYHTRTIGPAYLSGTQTGFGTPFTALGARDIRPPSFSPITWGVAVVRDRAQQISPTPRASTLQFGTPLVRDRAQTFYPFGADSAVVGYPIVNLHRRYLNVQSITQWPVDKDRFGYYNDVRNINRYMQANGFVHTLFGSNAFVLNKARPVRPYGEVQTRWGEQFTSHRIRYINPEWYTGHVFGATYARTRKVISLDGWGWSSMQFGVTGRVWSNLQTIGPYATYPHTTYGQHWIDQGARSLYPSSILTQPAGDPFVAFGSRQINPQSITPGYVGVHQLETHQNLINCWGYTHGYVGEPAVSNLTPEIKVYGAYAYVGGNKPRVELMKRYVQNPATQNHGYVQAPFVSYRTRTIRPPSPDYLRWGGADVRFDQSQQTPPQQLILPPSVQAGAGVVPYWEWADPATPWSGSTISMPSPSIKLNTVFPPSLGLFETFGVASTRSMVIFVPPGPSTTAFGATSLSGGTKWVRPQGWFSGINPSLTNQVIGPQYLRLDAKWDTTYSEWYSWNYHTFGNSSAPSWQWNAQTAGPVFGSNTVVQNKHRRIYPHGGLGGQHAPASAVGSPWITTRPQYVRPDGVLGYKRGMPDVSHMGDKPILVYSWQDTAWGNAVLNKQDYGPKWVYVGGIAAPSVTMGRVELKNRRVYPSGISSWLSQKGAQYIGPYLRIYASASNPHTLFGTPYIDFKHRSVTQLPVSDDLPASYGPRVKHQARGYFIEGTNMFSVGTPSVSTGIGHISPVGWEEFETGFSFVPVHYPGLSKLRTQNFITRESIIFTETGNAHVTHS